MKTLPTILLAGTMVAGLAACSNQPNTADTTMTNDAAMNADGAAVQTATTSPDRLRGTITAVTPTSMTVQTYDGQTMTVSLNDKTGYAWVLPSSLSDLKKGDFIGTATTGADNALKAVEVVIFPDSMRGTGEGHYDWDTPAVIQAKGTAGGSSAMTNGTITNSAMTNGTVTNSAMTNGTVSDTSTGADAQQLTVSYKGGTSQVAVPKDVPVVRLDPAKQAILATGQKVFVKLLPGSVAQFVAAGKNGLMPPM